VLAGALPTSMQCGVKFSPDVVDKDGNQVCAPLDGDITKDCTPGDTSAFQFTVEPLKFASTIMATGQPRTADVKIRANVPFDPASITNITVTEGPAMNYTQFTVMLGMPPSPTNEIAIHWTATGGLAATTPYTITIPTTVTDAYHQPALQPFQIAFTTGAN